MWFVYSLISAVTYGSRSILEKKYLQSIDKYILAFSLRVFALPFFIIPFLINPHLLNLIPTLNLKFWLAAVFISVISTPFEMIFYYKALEVESVNFVVPLLAISPIFTTAVNAIVFHNYPTMLGIIGVTFLILGVYFLKIEALNEGFLKPIYYLIKNKAFRFMLLMLCSYSIGVVIDKVAIVNSNVYIYSLINYILVSISLFVLALFKSRSKFNQINANFNRLFPLGLIVAIYTIFRYLALDIGNAGYVAAIMSSSLLFTLFFSNVFLADNEVRKKIIPAVTITIGLIILKLFG